MKILIVLYFVIFPLAYADFDLAQMNFGLGMINTSFTETPSGLAPKQDSTEKEVVASGSVPVIGAFVEYEKFLNAKFSILGKSAFPLLSGANGSYVFLGSGVNYYFNSLSSTGSFSNKSSNIIILPKWRYHAGGGIGGAYLIYNTETAKKSDTLVEIFGNSGVTYTKNKTLGYRGEFSYARGIGFNSTAMTMKIFFGLVYTLY
jgi:hypothetical protein